MAPVLDEKKKDDELPVEEPDHAAPLRADVLGSIAGADPNSPAYLGKINHLITAHGALERPSALGPDFSGMTSDNERPVSQMGAPAGLMKSGTADAMPATPDSMAPLMGTPKPHRGFLGKIGHGLARMGNIAGDIFAPGIMEAIPGTDLNKAFNAAVKERNAARDRELAVKETAAGAEKSRAETEAAKEKFLEKTSPKTGLTPEETTIHDLMTGENGQPRVNPDTQKPYTYLEAFKAVETAKAAAKPDKPDTETQEAQRYERIKSAQTLKQPVTPEDLAWAGAYEKRKTLAPFATAVAQAPQKSTERSDKSFQLQNSALDKEATPIDQLNQRMGRLMDTINQNTPQADALVAPELLSVMSGGAGSGLRMNEAEIARIVGGRSNWESLQASIKKWSLDPKEALSITPEQRQEIRALAKTVQDKLIAKVKIVDDARDALIDADDPKEHRRIVADAKKKLDAIDAGGTGGPQPGDVENGYRFKGGDPKVQSNWEKVKSARP